MTVVCDYEHVCARAEQLEREGAREMRKLAEAKAISGPEHVDGTDGSEILIADGGEDESESLPALHIGDHVTDRDDDDDVPMLVVGLDTLEADAYELEEGLTVADVNPEYPADDDVVEIVFPKRTTKNSDDLKRYAYPRSRLELVTPIHDRDDDQDESVDGESQWSR